MKTLRSRVLLGTTVAVAVVFCLAGWTLFTLVQRALVGEVDHALEEKARVIASMVLQEEDSLLLEFTDELDLEGLVDVKRGEYLRLWAWGHLMYAFPAEVEPPPPEESAAEVAGEWTRLSTGERGRSLTLAFRPPVEDDEGDDDGHEDVATDEDSVARPAGEGALLHLVVAGDAREVNRALATLKALLAIVGLVTLGTAGLVLSFVVRRSLLPVGAVSERVAAIGEKNLATRLDPAGVPGELLPIVQRVNELLARIEAAFERERAFSNDVAHELRTPLAGLRATLEVTAKRPRSDAEYTAALRDSAALAEQLQAMVERLLQLARLDAGRSNGGSQPYVLGDVAVETWEPFAAQALARRLRVDLSMANGLEVTADRELVELILRNLYENAVTYADPGGEIRISTRSNGRGVILAVANTGSRLSQEEARAATQRFWRGDAARTEAGLHCGLGLALVEKAAAALAGRVDLRSRADGDFEVEVTLP